VTTVDIEIGSNRYRNTDGIVEIEGVPQLTVAVRPPSNKLLVNFVMFDDAGRVTAKVVDSVFAFNERRAYELAKTPTSLVISHAESGKIVLQIELKNPDCAVISKGEFLTIKAHALEITPTEWRVGKTNLSGGDADLQGKSIQIG
jgi:UDP-N-acetylglucosamine transferase subunit ALG13